MVNVRGYFVLFAVSTAAALRVPPVRLSVPQPAASTKSLYAQIDTVLRRGQQGDSASSLSASTARALRKKWMEMPPAELVEATLVSGAVLLDSFEEGLAILLEAEEGAALNISGRSYSALMRLAQAEERTEDVLRLMARTRAFGVETTDGQLLGAMRAAASLRDWGAVARLYAELSEGREAAASLAVELETYTVDPQVLGELEAYVGQGPKATRIKSSSLPTEREYTLALNLALQAHCERGDLARVAPLLERKRAQQACLSVEEYKMLLGMAKRLGTVAPLLALRPVDLKRSLEAEIEPKIFAFTNRMGMLAAGLGRIERGIVIGAAAAALFGGVALLSDTPDAADTAASVFSTADAAIVAMESPPVAATTTFSPDVASLLY